MLDTVGVGNLLLRLIDILIKLLDWMRGRVGRNGPRLPATTLGIVYQRCRRFNAQEAGKPAMHLMVDYLVTNNTDEPLAIVRAQLAYRKWLLKRTVSQIQFRETIPPHGMGEVRLLFRISPPPF